VEAILPTEHPYYRYTTRAGGRPQAGRYRPILPRLGSRLEYSAPRDPEPRGSPRLYNCQSGVRIFQLLVGANSHQTVSVPVLQIRRSRHSRRKNLEAPRKLRTGLQLVWRQVEAWLKRGPTQQDKDSREAGPESFTLDTTGQSPINSSMPYFSMDEPGNLGSLSVYMAYRCILLRPRDARSFLWKEPL